MCMRTQLIPGSPFPSPSEPGYEATSYTDEFVQHFDLTLYDSSEATSPIYESSNVTVLEAVAQHTVWFTTHPGTSKDALSNVLRMHRHILPQPNLPDSYTAAMKVIEPFLAKLLVFDVCQNDCVLFSDQYATLAECPICNSCQYKNKDAMFSLPAYWS